MGTRFQTKYPGIFYRETERIGGKGTEKVYYIVFKKDGKVYEEKAGRQFADKMTPAKAAARRGELVEGKRELRKEIRKKEEAERKAQRWDIERLWEEYKKNNPNLKGIVTDQNRFEKHLEPSFGKKEPMDMVPFDIDRLRIALLKKKKPATVRNVLELLRRIINFGVKKNLCQRLNFTIQMPTVNNLKTEDLTPDQLSGLLKAIESDSNTQAGNLMKLALYTGLRRSEMFKLKWQDIDFERGFIHIQDPKGGPDQKVPLNDPAGELLKTHPKSKSPYVFPGRKGKRRVDIKHQVNRIKDDAGIPKNFRALHGLRHVYASMLASSGQVDLYTLQKLLTHKSPTMTQRYAHLRDEALKKASNLAGDLISEAMNGEKKVVGTETR